MVEEMVAGRLNGGIFGCFNEEVRSFVIKKTADMRKRLGKDFDINPSFHEDTFSKRIEKVKLTVVINKFPEFLSRQDAMSYFIKVGEVAYSRFGMTSVGPTRYDQTIGLGEIEEESSLTEREKSSLEDELNQTEDFCKWFCISLRGYSAVINAHERRFYEYLTKL